MVACKRRAVTAVDEKVAENFILLHYWEQCCWCGIREGRRGLSVLDGLFTGEGEAAELMEEEGSAGRSG
jgi:hypothetical protein